MTFLALLLYSPPRSQASDFDAARAWNHLLAQCAFGPRAPGSPGHQKCLIYLESEIKKRASSVERQWFWGSNPVANQSVQLCNLIARFQPEKSRRILLCAHWDTRPWADQDSEAANHDKPILGANDGASGVAVLLEIARCLSLKPPRIGVDIVFFDGEDMGREGHLNEYLLGSREYASNLTLPLPEAAILLDMVGDKYLSIPQELYSRRDAPQLVEEIFNAAQRLNQSAFDPQPGQAVYDDHLPLLQAGIPAVDLVDFDYIYWHTLHDTPENCSPQSLQAVGEVVLHWLYQKGTGK